MTTVITTNLNIENEIKSIKQLEAEIKSLSDLKKDKENHIKAIMEQAGLETKGIPVTTEEYGLSKAARPFNSRLDKAKLVENGFKPLPVWQDALARYLKEMEQSV